MENVRLFQPSHLMLVLLLQLLALPLAVELASAPLLEGSISAFAKLIDQQIHVVIC